MKEDLEHERSPHSSKAISNNLYLDIIIKTLKCRRRQHCEIDEFGWPSKDFLLHTSPHPVIVDRRNICFLS